MSGAQSIFQAQVEYNNPPDITIDIIYKDFKEGNLVILE